MPVPSAITDLSTTLASNSPAGSDNVFPDLDNYLRAHAQFVALLRDGRGLSTEVSLASAATCDIGGAASMFVQITGTTTITSFGTNYLPRILRFAGVLTLTHNATTLILPTGANITTAAGDMCLAVPVGTSGWRVLQYQRASEGADFVSFLQSGTGASSRTVQSKLRDVVSVLDFGADPTGSADSTTAIQNAINASKNVYLPAGTYRITSPLYMTGDGTGGTRLIGAGVGTTTINKTTTTVGTGSNTARGGAISDSYAVDAAIILTHLNSGAFDDYAYNCEISNLQINSNSLNNAYAIFAPRAALLTMKNVETLGFQYGYTTYDTWMSSFERVTHNGNGRTSWRGFNWTLDSTSGPTGTSCNFMDCWARDGSGTGWSIDSLGYTALNNCGADNITGIAYQFISSQITMNGCGMENITATASGNILDFVNSIAVVNAMYGFQITGANLANYVRVDSSNVSFNDCKFTDFVTVNGAYNLNVANGTKLFDNATQWPSNGNTFVSYSGGALRDQPFNDALVSSSGTAYAIRSATSGIRRENYLKAIAATATNIFTLSMGGSPASSFVHLRMFGNDSSYPNGAIYQEVVFTFHQDGSYYQNSSIVNSTQAGNGLTTTPTYSISQVAGVWTVSMTPGASGAIGNVTLIAEVLGVGATSTTFAWV